MTPHGCWVVLVCYLPNAYPTRVAETSPMDAKKVYWLGRHANQQAWGAPVSKVHKAGLEVLRSLGWEQVPDDTPHLPVFAFTTRKGANYAASQPQLPRVRQFPQQHTACLDDKRQLHLHLTAAGQQQLLPQSWSSLDDYTTWLQQQTEPESITTAADSMLASSPDDSLPACVFVKHRSGVKGQAVYVLHTRTQFKQLQQKLQRSAADFIVQQEVAPPMLLDGRKFVLRLHVLAVLQHGSCCGPPAAPAVMQPGPDLVTGSGGDLGLNVYVHENVIVLPHAVAYDAGSSNPAVHISSKGTGHPLPFLLHKQLQKLHAQVWPQLQQLAARTVDAVCHVLVPTAVHQDASLYHLFGFDVMVLASGQVVLLEVNSYPAIASGTMSAVSTDVYTRLIEDMVRLLVLPLTGDAELPEPGGFKLCGKAV